ncbi:DUF4339 domain-containing protein [Prolixibacter denitrificans]|uniref:Uncharacterized protein DUF4339 n=1 Tax=Prolixibacter denitrificans TaxID=1541063 RepID=A0A2P8CFB5_9BACT|nr:DUF4339 domain-containing protein [Prolixibacter denitrificans]PSK83671.1 uncharacterized protein DUF4339 [Prolixibacter denitrificans]GET23217.1 hypothetical protein JCM18694_34630 [Prolixibacter denitrificans]
MKEWYYIADDDRYGPFSLDDLEGRIKETTKVWKKGMSRWEKAMQVQELAGLFRDILPPVPAEDKKLGRETEAFRYIRADILSGWIFLLMLVVEIVLQMLDMDDIRFYGFVLFLSLLALVRLLTGMKKYLSLHLEIRKPAINVNWVIVTSIPIYILMAYERGRVIDNTLYSYGILVVVLAFILNGYHYLRLAQKLSLLKRVGVTAFRNFAYLQFFYSILVFMVVIVALFLMIFTDSAVLSSPLTLREGLTVLFIEMLPYLFLQYGLMKVKRNYFVHQPAY